ncbi:hypothetical protein CWI42_040960 [Ordospora colligata]|uniref:Uncharacterized protein n=1 Tax=Ordospora colligata OC4 TaxID=1354746 RepID=A0A0B2UFP3_9MICR|nr:uncharacterized protein M896_040970 [Ordospora colligata OC4]KHN69901.1 hypothetical protein M896_040970 [Ordospora colligata OC4]TBU16071.1 hypothetical protein CWI41_040960 [Ordospora colligata]TBU16284.1 hypothetical protein CWI40_040960 [Ordospora colligata]TBU18988.1 hypothetical protein CWI42_040960 [Ordospora colligata]
MEFSSVGDELSVGDEVNSCMANERMDQLCVVNDLDVYKTTFCWWTGCAGDAIDETLEFCVPFTEDKHEDWVHEFKRCKCSGIKALIKMNKNLNGIKACDHGSITTNEDNMKTLHRFTKNAVEFQVSNCVYSALATNFYINSDDSDSEDLNSLRFGNRHYFQ